MKIYVLLPLALSQALFSVDIQAHVKIKQEKMSYI